MKRLIIIVCASLAGALAVGGCGSGPGGVGSIPFNPFGSEPAPSTGNEPPGSGGQDPPPKMSRGTIEELCASVCARFESVCPGSGGGANCSGECAASITSSPGCEAQFKAFLACLTTAPLSCSNGSLVLNGCEAEVSTFEACTGGGTTASP